jgi:penicillin-binding protein 1B
MQLGLPEIAEVLRQLGVQRRVNAYPAMLLGSVSLSPLEVAQIYQTLAAGGFHAPLRAIREVMDARSQPLQRYPLKVDQVVAPGPTYLVDWALQQVVAEGTAKGLSKFLDPGLRVAGKTGTTNDLRDSWFAGFTGDKVAVVWVGRDDNQSAGLSGASGALRVWGDTLRRLRPQPLALLPPDGVEYHWIEPVSGLLADADCPGARQIPFIRGSAPTAYASCAVAEQESDSFFRRFFE